MNYAKFQMTLDPRCMTGFSVCIEGLQWSFIFFFMFILCFLLPAEKLAKTLSMVFRYCEKLKICDWEGKCLKYMNWNL